MTNSGLRFTPKTEQKGVDSYGTLTGTAPTPQLPYFEYCKQIKEKQTNKQTKEEEKRKEKKKGVSVVVLSEVTSW